MGSAISVSLVDCKGAWQFKAAATARATWRFPTPSGPAKIKLGGRDSRATACEIRLSRARWPVISENGMPNPEQHRITLEDQADLPTYTYTCKALCLNISHSNEIPK